MNNKELYEAPATTVVEVKTESGILIESQEPDVEGP